MNQTWICVYKSSSHFDAAAVQGNLESAGIPTVLLNKQDSSYLSFGYVEVHVQAEHEQDAKAIINGTLPEPENTSDGI